MASRVLYRPPPLGNLRLASVDDIPAIMELITEPMSKTFRIDGPQKIEYLIENCVLAVTQLDENDTLVGFLALEDYPPIPSVHPRAWEEYIWAKYKTVDLNSRNTMFLHMICWKLVYSREVVDNMLKSVFMHDRYLQYIVMVKTLVKYQLLVPEQSRPEASFKRVTSLEKGIPGDRLPVLCIADKNEVNTRLKIRRAVEEDNDDIVPIIEAHSARIREMYGEFYVSELVSKHPENKTERVLLVCEHKEVAVGVMCLNTQINFEALDESFELSPFAGLKKLDQAPNKKSHKEADSNTSESTSNVGDPSSLPVMETKTRNKEKGRVTWIFDENEFKDLREPPVPVISALPATNPAQLDILNLLEAEEEIEFDIINIDTDLMRVPRSLQSRNLEEDTGPIESIKKIINGSRKDAIAEKPKGSVSIPPAGTKPPEPPRHSGAPNAFLLELFAMHHDYDERYGFDMLEAAYELFPDRDYCVICLPSSQSSFPLLEHFTLVTAYGNRMRFMNDSLYVAHVNSVRGKLQVRLGEAYDIHSMHEICEHSPMAKGLIDLYESSLVSHSLECYVMLSENQPVGMIVLGPLDDYMAIRTQYDLEPDPQKPNTDAMVLSGIVSPVFEAHYRWFMRELLRNSNYSTLFWICRLFAKRDLSPIKHLTSIAGHMVPVHPRSAVPNIGGIKDLDDSIYKKASIPFALWVLDRPLTSLPKVYVNSNIVVVGASHTALAFLETLLLGPKCQYLTFSNVTLVSEHGLPTGTEYLLAAETCVPRAGRYTDRYLKSVPFYFYLDVMTAVMVGIDRKKKCIHLKGGGVKYYDELVLTCGQQFQHPDYLHGPLQLVKEVELGKPCDRLLMDDPKYKPDLVPQLPELPENVMLINSYSEANICLKRLLHMIKDYGQKGEPDKCLSIDNPIIVYGDCIEAYCCIAALLELGIFSDMIIFVDPFPSDDPAKIRVNCFNNETVDERVQASLKDLGICVYRKYSLTGWQHENNRVNSINLMSQLHYMTLPCFALFYYGIKAIDVFAFKAINESGLVYDGGLVVGTSFETNDANVYGAGTCVKYSRLLYANPLSHRNYCSEDVGEALAKMFLKKMDPFAMCAPSPPSSTKSIDLMPRYSSSIQIYRGSNADAARLSLCGTKMPTRWQPVMKFESPLVLSATLPGPLYYVKVRKPGTELPMEVQLSLPRQGHILITDKNNNYFRLKLNVLHCVEAVTCLSNSPLSCEILSQLYGKHEAFFNKLLSRFEMGLIDDLYEFFTKPWLSALYQETFRDLLKDINNQEIGTVYDLVDSKFDSHEESAMSQSRISLSCSDIPSCGFGPQDANKLGTFRSVLDNYVTKTTSSQNVKMTPTDIPSECGQSAMIRGEAASFWNTIGGERIVSTHLNKYLNRNNVVNAHYAMPDPDI